MNKVWRADSLLSDLFFGVAVFPCVLWGGDGKLEVTEYFLVMFFVFIITELTFHIVTLQSAAQFSYGYYI